MQLLDDVCNFNSVPNGDMGFSVEIEINCNSFVPNIINSLLSGGSFWSWMLPFNNSNTCGRLENLANIIDLLDFPTYTQEISLIVKPYA